MLWSENYSTGVAVMDQQHKELFQQVDILMDKSKASRIPETLDFLGKYVVSHFSTEEGLQQKSKYPKAAQHKQLHTDFIASYKKLRQEYDSSGQDAIILMKVTKTIMDWLKEHIRGHDKEFAQYYKSVS